MIIDENGRMEVQYTGPTLQGLGAVTPKQQANLAQRASILAAKAKALAAKAGVASSDVADAATAAQTAIDTAANRTAASNDAVDNTKVAKAEATVAKIEQKAGIKSGAPVQQSSGGMSVYAKVGIGLAVVALAGFAAVMLTRKKK